ncbi:beta-lactamase class C [Cupriavidus gilardii J11]|uniref:Beta-lactamase n=1 Tax=Cupriavidus gilardii J11 TaxID=936133 RepID=A0A562B7Z5_9BURK|nr:class C beta-lactamase [Cupriavidus gilardii]TWG81020.1 beta-lactamase class C [Cupriavidus gilardii J11]
MTVPFRFRWVPAVLVAMALGHAAASAAQASVPPASPSPPANSGADGSAADTIVDTVVRPVIARYGVPGMAVGVVWKGQRHFYNYGVLSRDGGRPVTSDTLFEIGSVSKTFTATLAAYASETGKLSFGDPVARHLPELHGSAVGKATVLDLATHTTGLPLQVPDDIATMPAYWQYLKRWQPPHPLGSHRVYSNNGIGVLGLVAASSLGESFQAAVTRTVLEPIGLKHTYYRVPPERNADYAQGHTSRDVPIRMRGDLLWQEAYGIKSSSADLLRFVEANMHGIPLEATLQRAVDATHTAYFRTGAMGQALVWERYRYPATLQALLEGNEAVLKARPVTRLAPPEQGDAGAWLHKTGSTNGFAAYALFVSQQKIGLVLLANKNFPLDERVRMGYEIVTRLVAEGASKR